jgi:hypothetical protein
MMTAGTSHFVLPRLCRVVILLWMLVGGSRIAAHPIEYHLQPLQPAEIERVVATLEQAAAHLKTTASPSQIDLPDDAMGITVALWSIEDALRADKNNPDALAKLLQESGYTDPRTAVLEWELETQRVLEAYETRHRNLTLPLLQNRIAALEEKRAALSPQQQLQLEQAIMRDHQLLSSTGADIESVGPYAARLDKLFKQLGLQVRN